MGYLPYISFDWTQPDPYSSVQKKLSTEEAREYVKRMESVCTTAQANIRKTQEVMQGQANRHCQEPDFGPKDKVWITTKN